MIYPLYPQSKKQIRIRHGDSASIQQLQQEIKLLNQEIGNLAETLATLNLTTTTPTEPTEPTPPEPTPEPTTPTLPSNLVLKSLLAEEKTFYVRVSDNFGNSGESENDAFASIEEALITLSSKYEISGHLILDLDGDYTLNCWYLPNFTGSGKITIKGNNSTIQFIQYQDSTTAYFSNWSGLSLILENITFDKGDCTKLCVEGGKIQFKNIDFGQLNAEFDNCRSTVLNDCISDGNNSQITGMRSTLELNRCNLIAQFKFCQLNLFANTFNRYFALEACQVTLNNPRFNYRYYTQTLSIINSTIEFKNSWLTFENLGGNPQTKPLIFFQSCNLKDFPNNLDVQGVRVFSGVPILKLINCTTPKTFNNVSYNFSQHSFINDGSAIELINTAILQELDIVGADIKRDVFSIWGNSNQLLEMINDLQP